MKVLSVVWPGGMVVSLKSTDDALKMLPDGPFKQQEYDPVKIAVQHGEVTVSRASRIVQADNGVGWDVFLTDDKLNGKYAGWRIACNVASRAEAIKIEIEWIETHIFGAPTCPQPTNT